MLMNFKKQKNRFKNINFRIDSMLFKKKDHQFLSNVASNLV